MDAYGTINVNWSQGYKGDAVYHIDTDVVCFACGNTVKFVNDADYSEFVFHSPGNGVQKIAASAAHSVFAIIENGLNPRIFVCQYPEMEIISVLEGGAQLQYNQITFSYSENYLAAASDLPDFTLFLWNWRTGELRCKEKLLSEEPAISLLFSPVNQCQMALIGRDNVTIWTIEEFNVLATLKSKKVQLPASDGTVVVEEEEVVSRSGTRMGFHVGLPASTKAGLAGEELKKFQAPENRHPRVQPSSQYWSSSGELYVGCADGQLFRVKSDSGQVHMLLGGTSDALLTGRVIPGMFNSLVLNAVGLVAGGTDGVLRTLQIDNNGIKIKEAYKGDAAITCISFSPDVFVELIYGTSSGAVYLFNTATEARNMVFNTHSGPFVDVSYSNGGKFCLTCREDGEVQAWDAESGIFIDSLSLCTKVSSLACCPSSLVLAVGTCSGHVIYVDISSLYWEEGGELRQVGKVRMHRSPINFLQYDSRGNFLLAASSEKSQIFVISTKPSAGFECIGYVDCQGTISDLSVHQPSNGKATVVATITPTEEIPSDDDLPSNGVPTGPITNVLQLFTLTTELLKEPDDHFQSLRKNFKDSSIHMARYELATAIDSAVVTTISDHIDVAVLSQHKKKLMKFNLPLQEQKAKSEQTLYEPTSDHEGHQINGGCLALSPHGQWLASSSRDGCLVIRDLRDIDNVVSILAHSPIEYGTRSIRFSPDASQIVTVGMHDQSITGFAWKLSAKGRQAINAAVEHARLLNMQLRSDVEAESEALSALEIDTEKTEDGSATEIDADQTQDGDEERTEQQRATSAATTVSRPRTPDSDATWLEKRQEVALKEESAKYAEVKKTLRRQIKDMRTTILKMMQDNEHLPEIEQLRHDEYNLDTEEQKRMQSEQDRDVQKVREEINFENLAQRYLAYLVKKECWDDMATKGRAIRSFSSNVLVSNYPTMEVTAAESALLQSVTRMRKIEIAANAARKSVVETVSSTTALGGEEDEEEEDTSSSGGQLSLHGSLGPNYSGGNELFYSQFDLHTREEKISQTVLVKDAIRRIKDAFNESFLSVYRNKEQEIARVKERNVRIRQILKELDMDSSSVVDPSLGEDEMPEKVFEVTDDEVKVERVLSEEQKKDLEEQERIEEEKKAAAKGDNKRERALSDMMGGVLEVKKEDMLKQDIPPPDCIAEKLEKDWTDDDKKKAKEYEKKNKELQNEREKYRKNLENELKKLQQNSVDGMSGFDESLTQLYNRKVKIEMVVNQEELKILRLTHSIMTDDELSTHEASLNYLFELKNTAKAQSIDREADVRNMVEEYREIYDSVVAEDKMLDRGFKRDFSDVPLSLSDQLYKLFKRRPKPPRRLYVERTGSLDPYSGVGVAKSSALQYDEGSATLHALTELDNEVNMPEGCDATLWTRLCQARRVKVESEIRVKQCATTLAEMAQYLQQRQEEDEGISREIDDVARQQMKLYEDILKNTLNLEVQFLLKQGRVEITCGPFIPDYSDSILIHRGVVEDLNGTIRTLGESKVSAMTESKDFKKGIHQLEWDRKRMLMQMEDLRNKARHIQMLKLTKDLQSFLNEENHAAKQSKQMAVLEQTLALQDKQLDKNIAQKNTTMQQLMRTIRTREHENQELDKILEELHVSVSERKNIADVNVAERAKDTPDRRLRGIVQRRRLVDLAKAQAQEVAVLRAEVERLRMKTFPALVQVEH